MRQPCLDCGTPTDGTRCPTHAAAHAQHTNRKQTVLRRSRGRRAYQGGGYRAAAAAVRATATHCWLCGDGPRPDDPWQADHVIPVEQGGASGPLAPAHRSCNVGRANALRAGRPDPALDRTVRRRRTSGDPRPHARTAAADAAPPDRDATPTSPAPPTGETSTRTGDPTPPTLTAHHPTDPLAPTPARPGAGGTPPYPAP